MRSLILSCLFVLGVSASAIGQAPKLSPRARIYLLTEAPGTEIYSQFGHSAYRLQDPLNRLDVVFNYGTFNFRTDYFVLKFARGKLDYYLSTEPYAHWLGQATLEQRTVYSQRLRLSPTQLQRLANALYNNRKPENRYYRYDFFFDNCATRLQTIVEQALGDSVRFDTTWGGRKSYRQLLAHYLSDNPGLRFGIHLGLGSGADAIATTRQYNYLPDSLLKIFSYGEIRTATGWASLTLDPERLVPGTPLPPPAFDYPLAITLIILLLAAWATWREHRRGYSGGRHLAWHDRLGFAVLGFAGLFISFLWFGTDHSVTPRNWNLLWAFPLHGMLIFLVKSTRLRTTLIRYGFVGALAALCTVVVALLGWQYFPPAAFPLMGYAALRLFALARRLQQAGV